MKISDSDHAALRAHFGDAYIGDAIKSISRDGGAEVHALLGREIGENGAETSQIGFGLADWTYDKITSVGTLLEPIINVEFVARGVPRDLYALVLSFDKVVLSVENENSFLAGYAHSALRTVRAIYEILVERLPTMSSVLGAIVSGMESLFGSESWASGVVNSISAVTAFVKAGAAALFRNIVRAFKKIAALFVNAIEGALDVIASLPALIYNALPEIAVPAKKTILRLGYFAYALTNIMQQRLDAKQRSLDAFVQKIGEPFVNALNEIWGVLAALGDRVLSAASAIRAAIAASAFGTLVQKMAGAFGDAIAPMLAWLSPFATMLLSSTQAISRYAAMLVAKLGTLVIEPLRQMCGLDMDAGNIFDTAAMRPIIEIGLEHLQNANGPEPLRAALVRIAALDASVDRALDALWLADAETSIGAAWQHASVLSTFAVDQELSASDNAVFASLLGRTYEQMETDYAEAHIALLEVLADIEIGQAEESDEKPRRSRRRRVGAEAPAPAPIADFENDGKRKRSTRTAATTANGGAPALSPAVGVQQSVVEQHIEFFLVRWAKIVATSAPSKLLIKAGAPGLVTFSDAVSQIANWANKGRDRTRTVRVRSWKFIAIAALGSSAAIYAWAGSVASAARAREIETLRKEIATNPVLKIAFDISKEAPSFSLLVQDLKDAPDATKVHPIVNLRDMIAKNIQGATDAELAQFGGSVAVVAAGSGSGVNIAIDATRLAEAARELATPLKIEEPEAVGYLRSHLYDLEREKKAFEAQSVKTSIDTLLLETTRAAEDRRALMHSIAINGVLQFFTSSTLTENAKALYNASKTLRSGTTLDSFEYFMTNVSRALSPSFIARYKDRWREHITGESARDAYDAFTSTDPAFVFRSVWSFVTTPFASLVIASAAATWFAWGVAEVLSSVAPDPDDAQMAIGERFVRSIKDIVGISLDILQWIFLVSSRAAALRGVLAKSRGIVRFGSLFFDGQRAQAFASLVVSMSGVKIDAEVAQAAPAARACVVCRHEARTKCECCSRACCSRACQRVLHEK